MKRRFSALWIAILALFAAPIALPLALCILAVLASLILGILAVVGGILVTALAAVAGSVLGIIGGIAIIPQTLGGGLVTIGLSLMLIGLMNPGQHISPYYWLAGSSSNLPDCSANL